MQHIVSAFISFINMLENPSGLHHPCITVAETYAHLTDVIYSHNQKVYAEPELLTGMGYLDITLQLHLW